MKRFWLLAAVMASAFLTGCGNREDVAGTPDRQAALIGCSTRVVDGARHDYRLIRTALRRIEACMAEQRLPGHAAYDGKSQAVRYAYEADLPVLRF
jgi:hypothetical protein